MGLVYKLPNLFDEDGSSSLPWPIEMSLPLKKLRLPAEWENQSSILISWPHKDSDWCDMLHEVTLCYKEIVKAIIKVEKLIIVAPDISLPQNELKDLDNTNIVYLEIPTNDTWARDFGGIIVEEADKLQLIDFKFNGWGLKFASDKDNLITSRMFDKNIFNASYLNQLSFVLEGGSIESDGKDTILTTSECLLSKNRNGAFTKLDIEQYIKWIFGMKRVLWLDHGFLEGDDTDSHIDTLARFANENTIMYIKCEDQTDSHYKELLEMEKQLSMFKTSNNTPYKLVPLPFPNPIFDEDGNRLPATYANFLIMNRQVLVPTYNQPENDEKALNIFKEVFPDRDIIGIDCNALIKQHGSLHCITMQFPYRSIKD